MFEYRNKKYIFTYIIEKFDLKNQHFVFFCTGLHFFLLCSIPQNKPFNDIRKLFFVVVVMSSDKEKTSRDIKKASNHMLFDKQISET